MQEAGFTMEDFPAVVRHLHEAVVDDLQRSCANILSKNSEPGSKPDPSSEAEVAPHVKQETAQDVQMQQKPETSQVVPSLGPDSVKPEVEAMMTKEALMDLHGMKRLPKGSDGKSVPVWCKHCNVTLQGKGRAKVWQHCAGQEHRARWQQRADAGKVKSEVKREPIDLPTRSLETGKCMGLCLEGEFAKNTRLGSDMKPLWLEYTKFAELQKEQTVSGERTHKFTQEHRANSWTLKHRVCVEHDEEDVRVHTNQHGEAVCKHCFDLGSDQKLLARISAFVLDMDAARLLFQHMFAADKAFCEQHWDER